MVRDYAIRCGLTPSEVAELGIKMMTRYDVRYDAIEVGIAWGLTRWHSRRAMTFHISATAAMEKEGWMLGGLLPAIGAVNFKTEYYCCMLPENLRKKVDRVALVRGNVVVVFTNSRAVSTPRETYPTPEFLATCGLVFDLPAGERQEPIHV